MNRSLVTIGIGLIVVVMVIISLNTYSPISQLDQPTATLSRQSTARKIAVDNTSRPVEPTVILPSLPTPTQQTRSIFTFGDPSASTQMTGTQKANEKLPTPTPHPELIKRGQRLFYAVGCFYCHGIKAEGAVGPPLAGTWLSLDMVIHQVYQPRGDMQVFDAEAVPEEDVTAIYAYLQALAQPPGFRPQILPDHPDSTTGEALYGHFGCFGCHGFQGEGGFGPPLAGTQLSLAEIQRQVRIPKARMPAFGPALISDEELGHIQAFLKSLPPSDSLP